MHVIATGVVVATLVVAQAKAPPPPAEPKAPGVEPTPIPVPVPTVRPTIVLVDDRTVKDQAPGQFLTNIPHRSNG